MVCEGGPADVLMVIQPSLPQVRNRDRLEAQGRRGPHLQLAVDLGGHLPGQIPVRADPWPPASAAFNVVQIPHSAPQKGPDFSHAKRLRFASHFGSPRRTLPLQNATKNATNGKF